MGGQDGCSRARRTVTCTPLLVVHCSSITFYTFPLSSLLPTHHGLFFACVAAVRPGWQVGKSGPTSRAARWSWEPGAGLCWKWKGDSQPSLDVEGAEPEPLLLGAALVSPRWTHADSRWPWEGPCNRQDFWPAERFVALLCRGSADSLALSSPCSAATQGWASVGRSTSASPAPCRGQ